MFGHSTRTALRTHSDTSRPSMQRYLVPASPEWSHEPGRQGIEPPLLNSTLILRRRLNRQRYRGINITSRPPPGCAGSLSQSIEPSLPVTMMWVFVMSSPTALQLFSEFSRARFSVVQEECLPVLESKQAWRKSNGGLRGNIPARLVPTGNETDARQGGRRDF